MHFHETPTQLTLWSGSERFYGSKTVFDRRTNTVVISGRSFFRARQPVNLPLSQVASASVASSWALMSFLIIAAPNAGGGISGRYLQLILASGDTVKIPGSGGPKAELSADKIRRFLAGEVKPESVWDRLMEEPRT